MNKAAFLDRDGVINRKAPEGEYITSWEAMEILPGVAEAITLLHRSGFRTIVVSNQRCVAKGLITIDELEALHHRMCDVLAQAGAKIDAVYYCPHENEPICQCRKPQPGMLLQAAREHNIDLSASWMIGDSRADMEAGKNAGCRTAIVTRAASVAGSDAVAPSLLEATRHILDEQNVSRGKQLPPSRRV